MLSEHCSRIQSSARIISWVWQSAFQVQTLHCKGTKGTHTSLCHALLCHTLLCATHFCATHCSAHKPHTLLLELPRLLCYKRLDLWIWTQSHTGRRYQLLFRNIIRGDSLHWEEDDFQIYLPSLKVLVLFVKNYLDSNLHDFAKISFNIPNVKQLQGWRLWVSVNTCSYQAADSTLQQLQSVVHRLGTLLRHAENFHWNYEVFHRLFWNFCLSW